MSKATIKRFSQSLAAGTLILFGTAIFSACNLTMVKEEGYTESRYEVTSAFSGIRIDAEGGLNLTISYGDAFSVGYSESDQEKFTFSENGGTLFVEQKRSINATLLEYKRKELNITVPSDNKISSLDVDVDGRLDCSLAGEFDSVAFDIDGGMMPDMDISARSVSFDVDGGMRGKMSVEADTVDIDCDGTFDMQMTGTAGSLTVNCNGIATFGSRGFTAESARFDCDGTLKFEITCNVSLSVSCDGVCEGTYYGNPILEKKISGGQLTKGE